MLTSRPIDRGPVESGVRRAAQPDFDVCLEEEESA
jgi:hypothetical protein